MSKSKALRVKTQSGKDELYEIPDPEGGEPVRLNMAARLAIHDVSNVALPMIDNAIGALTYLSCIDECGGEGDNGAMYRGDVYSVITYVLEHARDTIGDCMARTRPPLPSQEGGAS